MPPNKQDRPLLIDDDPNAPDEEHSPETLRRAFGLPEKGAETDAGKDAGKSDDDAQVAFLPEEAFFNADADESEETDEPAGASEEEAKEEDAAEDATEDATEDAAEDAAEGAAEDAQDEKPAKKPVEAPVDPDDVPKFTQKQLNAIMAQEKRISREAQTAIKELEALSGMPVDKLREFHRTQQTQKLADETGLTEEEAAKIVADREKARQLELRLAELEAEQKAVKRQQTYMEQKAKYANHPNVRRYEAEIDRFARENAGWDYDLAVVAVLGQKAKDGLLQQEVEDITRRKTIANVAKGNVRVESSRQAAPNSPAAFLSAEQRRIIAEMKGVVPGLTERGVAKQIQRMKRTRR